MTYKLGDFISCLKYIDVAMIENPDYEKGHKLKKRIYDECPYIDPDPSNWNKEPDLSRIKFNQEPKPAPVEKELYTINISKWNLAPRSPKLCNLTNLDDCDPTTTYSMILNRIYRNVRLHISAPLIDRTAITLTEML